MRGGSGALEHTSSRGINRNPGPRSDSSEFPSCKDDSRSKTSWQSEELVLYDSAVLFSILLLVPQFLPVSISLNLQEDDAKFFEFSKSADDGSPREGRPSKTCPDVPNEFRVSSKSRG